MRVLIPLADGVEEMEAVILIDILRRAKLEVHAVAMTGKLLVQASRGVKIEADTTWNQIVPEQFDMIAIPGGMGGTRLLEKDARLLKALRAFHDQGKPLAAICAGPLVLQAAGLLAGRNATCHPGVAGEFTVPKRLEAAVVEDGGIITSQGPGTAIAFALAIVRRLAGSEMAEQVADGLVIL